MPLQLDRMPELSQALDAGALLLAPNYRSSDQLLEQLCRYRLQQGHGPAFPRPAIRAIDLWVADLWQRLAALHDAAVLDWQVLEPADEQLLWQQVISATSPELLLLNREGTAVAAAEAWRLLQQAQLSLGAVRQHLVLGDNSQTDDREHAYAWFQAFARQCQAQQLLTLSDRLQHLLRFITDGSLRQLGLLPPRLLLSGFDAPPPLYQALFAALAEQQVGIDTWAASPGNPTRTLEIYREPADECRAAAAWAQALLDQDPQASIGIITADSTLQKGMLEQAFAQRFSTQPGAYSNTLAGTLDEVPFVHTALQCLSWLDDSIDTLSCCSLLRSPWLIAADDEADARAELELLLRKPQALQLRCAELRSHCLESEHPWYCPVLGTHLLDLGKAFRAQPKRQSLPRWLQFFEDCWHKLLVREALFECGAREVIQSWEKLLGQVQSSAALYGELDFNAARQVFTQLTHATQLGTGRQQASILLLTPAMAAGLRFNHLWCLQMTEDLWPGERQAHPYLPLSLQREHAMPGAERQQALHDARALLDNLRASTSGTLVFSHANSDQDLPLRRSGLLPADLPTREQTPSTRPGALHPALGDMALAACIIDDGTVTVPLALPRQAEGGASLLSSQSACPFKAFAQYRLRARELPQPLYGVPARVVGECIHAALQQFWRGIGDQATLLASSNASIDQALEAALRPALQRLERLYPALLTPRWLDLERKRLLALLQDWLEQERLRGAFRVIATEQELFWSHRQLRLRLRIDRLDRHADGSSVIIDYKTGNLPPPRWEEQRPAAPQLPLYAQALDSTQPDAPGLPPAKALLYAQIQVDRRIYTGIAADDSVYPGVLTPTSTKLSAQDWGALEQGWQRVLGLLAEEFLQGYVAVQPARGNSCTYCHLGSLCRIDELNRDRYTDEDSEAAGGGKRGITRDMEYNDASS